MQYLKGARTPAGFAWLLHPTELLFFPFRIGSRELRGVGTHRWDAGKSVHGVDVYIDHRWSFRLRVLRERGH